MMTAQRRRSKKRTSSRRLFLLFLTTLIVTLSLFILALLVLIAFAHYTVEKLASFLFYILVVSCEMGEKETGNTYFRDFWFRQLFLFGFRIILWCRH